jgi:D-tyrosyl-tRNA(Tyr) deacylase
MRAVVQRCSNASVAIESNEAYTVSGAIEKGILVYLGVAKGDDEKDAFYLSDKIAHLRIFMDEREKMNLSVIDLGYPILVVSQFTLLADARNGRRPSYSDAAPNDYAKMLYEKFCGYLQNLGIHVETGVFREMMKVRYTNEGPVTILLDSKKQF